MDFPGQKTVFLILVLVLILYLVLIPIWFWAQRPYGSLVATVSTALQPILGVEGSVTCQSHGPLAMDYILRDPRTGGWGSIKQRLPFSAPDLPLAVAVALSMVFLGWRRRLVIALIVTAALFSFHVILVTISAWRLARILGTPSFASTSLDRELNRAAESIAAYREVSLVVVLLISGLVILLLMPKRQKAPAA